MCAVALTGYVLQNPSVWSDKAIELAGDELTPLQMCEAFSRAQVSVRETDLCNVRTFAARRVSALTAVWHLCGICVALIHATYAKNVCCYCCAAAAQWPMTC